MKGSQLATNSEWSRPRSPRCRWPWNSRSPHLRERPVVHSDPFAADATGKRIDVYGQRLRGEVAPGLFQAFDAPKHDPGGSVGVLRRNDRGDVCVRMDGECGLDLRRQRSRACCLRLHVQLVAVQHVVDLGSDGIGPAGQRQHREERGDQKAPRKCTRRASNHSRALERFRSGVPTPARGCEGSVGIVVMPTPSVRRPQQQRRPAG